MLTLGPMPERVREFVARQIALAGELLPDAGESGKRGMILGTGSGFHCLLGEDGSLWLYDAGRSIWMELIPDGPEKVMQVGDAARGWPELAEWLPRRPPSAIKCQYCHGKGSYPKKFLGSCPQCAGMGWLCAEQDGRSTQPDS